MRLVFAGPSIPAETVRAAGAVPLPPARQGDVYRAVRDHRPHAIGLIDGAFLDVPSVWHREILWALSEGVHVLGAASMGALRAAELDGFGVVGVGEIYACYRDGVFEDDDEVAVEHGPAETGYAALSDAMVDLRATIAAARRAGAIGEAQATSLIARMKALPFPARSRAALAEAAGPEAASWLDTYRVAQKRRDAEALVAALAAVPASRFVARFTFTRALVWERFMASEMSPPRALRAIPPDSSAGRRMRRLAAGRAAALALLPPATDAEARAVFDAFRIEHRLIRHEDITAWLDYHGIDAATLARLMQDDATLDGAVEGPALRQAMADLAVLLDDDSP